MHGALLLLVLGYGIFVATHTEVVAAGSDRAGYLNCARLIKDGEWTMTTRQLPGVNMGKYAAGAFEPLEFAGAPGIWQLRSTAYVGWPLQLGVVGKLIGIERAGYVLLVFFAMMGLLLTYLLCLEWGLPAGWALGVTSLLAVCPTTLGHFVMPMSDGAAMTWVTGSVYFAWLARRKPRVVWLAGVCVGMACLIRPPNPIIFPAVLFALPFKRRAWVSFVLGGLPFLVFLAWYNYRTTGLWLGNAGFYNDYFKLEYVLPRFNFWVEMWGTLLGPGVLLLWVSSFAMAVKGDRPAIVILLWSGAFVLFYGFFEASAWGWWYLRFLLPALPAVLCGAARAAREFLWWTRVRLGHRPWVPVLAGLLVGGIWLNGMGHSIYYVKKWQVLQIPKYDLAFSKGVTWLEQRIPANALVVAMEMTASIYYYGTHPIARYDVLGPSGMKALIEECASTGIPVYAFLGSGWEEARLNKRFPGMWRKVETAGLTVLWEPAAPDPSETHAASTPPVGESSP